MNGNRSAPVIFILTPIIKLMDRLPYLYKFILVSTVFTLPLALLCAVQIQHLKADITTQIIDWPPSINSAVITSY